MGPGEGPPSFCCDRVLTFLYTCVRSREAMGEKVRTSPTVGTGKAGPEGPFIIAFHPVRYH